MMTELSLTLRRALAAGFLAILTLLWVAPAQAQRARLVIDQNRLSTWLEDSQSAIKAPALAVGIVSPERDLFLDLFGDPDLDDPFLLGPLSRSITGLALLLVLDDHDDYSLETPASQWFSSIPAEITLRDLLHQTSGLETDSTISPYLHVDASLDDLLSSAHWHPRGTLTDEDLPFAVLGHIASELAEQPFDELLEERIFAPLSLTSASASPSLANRQFTTGHQFFFGFPIKRSEPEFNPAFVPALFISMSPRDMTTWLRFLLNQGTHEGAELLSPDLLDELARLLSRSTGATATFTASMALRQEEEFALFVFANHNSWNAAGPTRILDGIVATLLQEDPPRGSNIEFILRLILGFLLLMTLANFLYDFFRWLMIRSFRLTGRQIGIVLLTTVVTASLTAALHLFWVPMPLLYATQPDLAIAIVLFATLLPLARLFGGFVHTYRTDAKSVHKRFGFS